MPMYNYRCSKCKIVEEKYHSIHKNPRIKCSNCQSKMERQICAGAYIATGMKPTLADKRETEYTKKVKDPERAVKSRKHEFGSEAVGNPSMATDPRHVIRRGRTLGGQQKEIDKGEFIKAAAKDTGLVQAAQKSLKNT